MNTPGDEDHICGEDCPYDGDPFENWERVYYYEGHIGFTLPGLGPMKAQD